MKPMTLARLSVCVLPAVWMLPTGLASGQTVQLKPKFAAGGENYLELALNITQKMRGGMFGEAGMTVEVSLTFGVLEEVESVSAEKDIAVRFLSSQGR